MGRLIDASQDEKMEAIAAMLGLNLKRTLSPMNYTLIEDILFQCESAWHSELKLQIESRRKND